MLIKYITIENDKRVHLQHPFSAGSTLCGKHPLHWHNSKRDVSCESCLKEQTKRPYPMEKPEPEYPDWFKPYHKLNQKQLKGE